MNANELADNISLDNCHLSHADRKEIANMLREQAKELDALNQAFGILFKHRIQQEKEIVKLKAELEDCICQGGHSEAYLKAKGRG
jgi:hypothetical protein